MGVKYVLIKQNYEGDIKIPLNIVYVDEKNIFDAGLSHEDFIYKIANDTEEPCGINIFNLDAVTTTSDGIMIEGAIVKMAAADRGVVNKEFGILAMEEIPYSEELVEEEPHLIQWKKNFSGKKLFRGPNPHTKLIPVHNVVMTGRAVNNNSATEMMNAVSMEEILLPIIGQVELLKGRNVLYGRRTGEVISVGIGMTVAEQYGRVFPTRQFRAGQTAHNSGDYAKTLKRHIPCIVADKKAFAKYIIQALESGVVPGRDIGCSPAILEVARHLGKEIDFDNIEEAAYEELASIGLTKEYLFNKPEIMTAEELIEKANDIIPGVENPILCKFDDIAELKELI